MIVENKYDIGSLVYLKTDPDQRQRMITQISVTQCGVRYCLSCGQTDTWHYDIEISESKDILKTVGVERRESE